MKKRAPKINKSEEWLHNLNIGYALDEDDKGNTLPAFLFIGATIPLLYEVFKIIAKGGYICKGFFISYERSALFGRRKHVLWRLVVKLEGYDSHILSLQQVGTMVEMLIQRKGHHITFFPNIEKFLNK